MVLLSINTINCMNLKKTTLLLVIISLFAASAVAEEMSYAAKTFRSNIQSFLREEGFFPTVDSDGSLCFKKEGTSYWIDVLGDKPFYVTFHREPLGTDNAPELTVLKAINDVNTNIRALKCCYMQDHVSFAIESYCYVAEDFKYVFYSYLNILEVSHEIVKEAYLRYDTASSISSSRDRSTGKDSSSGGFYRNSSSTASTTSGTRYGNTVYISGPILESTYHKWWATSLKINPTNTIVTCVVVPKTTSSSVCSTKNEYIEDCDTGKKYYIQSSSIGLDPQRTNLYSKESKSFTNTFPALPNSVKRINIWSGDDYYAKNLQIR